MNTKEAIEFMEKERDSWVSKEFRKSYDQVISLLKRGEAFEAIWNDEFPKLEEEFEESERELKREIEHWKFKYYNKGV